MLNVFNESCKKRKNIKMAYYSCKKNNLFFKMFLVVILLLTQNIYAENAKIELLDQKLAEIILLREKIDEKRLLLNDLLVKIESEEKGIINEIKDQQKKVKAANYKDAIKNSRIYFDLKLVKKFRKYITQINERLTFLKISDENIKFLFEQANDDIKIAQTLNNIKIAEFISKIDHLVTSIYIKLDKKLFFDNKMPVESEKKIWDKIMSKNR